MPLNPSQNWEILEATADCGICIIWLGLVWWGFWVMDNTPYFPPLIRGPEDKLYTVQMKVPSQVQMTIHSQRLWSPVNVTITTCPGCPFWSSHFDTLYGQKLSKMDINDSLEAPNWLIKVCSGQGTSGAMCLGLFPGPERPLRASEAVKTAQKAKPQITPLRRVMFALKS